MTKKKILFTSHTANFSKFNRPFMHMLKQQGYEIHYASAGEEEVRDCDKHFTVPFRRNPFKPANFSAYKELKKIIDAHDYALIHTHTPMGSVVTRLAARKARTLGTKVIYTAHGFHFFKGAPILNWLVYYPIEKAMARCADALVTINQEDFARTQKKFSVKKSFKIDGVGTDVTKFKLVNLKEKNELRRKYGFKKDDFILIYAAELNKNKNQDFLIKCIKDIQSDIPNVQLLLCGVGNLHTSFARTISRLGLDGAVKLMGYRKDMATLFQISDVAVASSIREGLGVNLIEAIAAGLPVVATANRGHRDLVENGVHGYLYKINDSAAFKEYIVTLYKDPKLAKQIGKNNSAHAPKYSLQNALSSMASIYSSLIPGYDSANRAEKTDMKQPVISVIVPAYNAGEKIIRTLDSIINQTAAELIKEVIVVDDGSTDDTNKIVKKYISTHDKRKKIKLITTKNNGVSKARNLGLEMAQGNWVALLDADDYWSTDKIQKQAEAIKHNPAIKFIGSNSDKRVLYYGEKLTDDLYKLNLDQYLFKTFPSTCSVLFEKKVLDTTGYFDANQSHAEDANLFMKIIHLYDGYYLTEPLLFLDEKPTFGHAGLSGDLKAMHLGCIKNITEAYDLGYVKPLRRGTLVLWELIRYGRRIFVTKLRQVAIKLRSA